MLETIQNIVITLILALTFTLLAWLLRTRKQQILTVVANLIQEAEQAIQGSGLGTEKKTKVVAQLEAMGSTVNTWLSSQIDNIVKYLNEKSGWFASSAGDKTKAALEEAAESLSETEG